MDPLGFTLPDLPDDLLLLVSVVRDRDGELVEPNFFTGLIIALLLSVCVDEFYHKSIDVDWQCSYSNDVEKTINVGGDEYE